MKFPLEQFWQFCNALEIETKEFGLRNLGKTLLGTQRYFIEQIVLGLDEGIHYFVCLKGRQLGISTICLALDLFWHFKYPGVQGTLVTDTEQNRDMFKSTLSMYMESLPVEYKIPSSAHNRNHLVLKNRSRMIYQVAGTGKNSGFGKGKAIMFLHGTETSNWGDPEGLASLEASFASINEKRLYVFESTAQAFNMFYDMWEIAREAKTQRAIFVGFWRNELYRCERGGGIHKVYWDGKLTTEETAWVREVKRLYGFDVDDEQIAWWRWQMLEVIKDENLMYQNFPPTETYAFRTTGSQFFKSIVVHDRKKIALARAFESFRFVLGANFEDTELVVSKPRLATLKIWEKPKPGGYYVIGADPAYGSSEWADRFCANVYRCFSDGMEQVAEFCTEECSTYQFAWVVVYLAGAYKNVMINLEINGPGQAVWSEVLNMRRLSFLNQESEFGKGLYEVLANIDNYLYKRPDSMGGGYNYHWKSTNETKERMLNFFKDGWLQGIITVNSIECLDEMKNVVRNEGVIGAPGRRKDDRVIASGLAAIAWGDFVRLRLATMGLTKAKSCAERDPSVAAPPVERAVANYLKTMQR